jgi:hypothetical protein
MCAFCFRAETLGSACVPGSGAASSKKERAMNLLSAPWAATSEHAAGHTEAGHLWGRRRFSDPGRSPSEDSTRRVPFPIR